MRRRIKSLLSHERRESSRADTRPNSQPGKPLDQDGSALSETSRSSPSFIAQEALPARPLSAAHGTLSSLNATPEPDPDPSLWNRAYIELREEQPKMVNTYETLLSAEIMDITSSASPPSQDQTEKTEHTINRISNDANLRQKQLTMVLNQGLQQANGNKNPYRIFGHEFILRDQIANAAKFVQAFNRLISEAVKMSPEASVAWAGVSVLLPILTNPSAAEEANIDGLVYVTSRASYYVQLEPILQTKHNPVKLQPELDKHIVDLYKHILEFQVMTVLRVYRRWFSKLARDIFRNEDWEGMLSRIKDLEEIIRKDSNNISTMASRDTLQDMKKTAEEHYGEMQSLLSVTNQHLEALEQQQRRTNQILENIRLNLPEVPEARYDSGNVQDDPKCEPGTRARIQQVITDWADGDSVKRFYWLVGPAGTGKSTLARTIADSFDSQKRLVAGYFFKRGDQGRNDTTRFFATLAAQIADAIPPFKTCLRHIFQDEDPSSIEKKSLNHQFDILLWRPFENLDPIHMGHSSKIIIIDALDECERLDRLPQILALLSKLCSKHELRIRIFFTSRFTGVIPDAFEPFLKANAVQKLELQTAFSEETRSDINMFLHNKFEEIRKKCRIQQNPWPTSEELDRIAHLATSPNPLFIYAATLCRFVNDGQRPGPAKNKLKLWLAQCDENKSQLDQMYEPILDEVFHGHDEKYNAQPLFFLHALVILATPVPAISLASLLNIEMDDVEWCLSDLHAVLDIAIPLNPHEPVRLLHKSFSDFLLSSDKAGTSYYRADEQEMHYKLAKNCIRRMELDLKQDICDIQQLGLSRDEIDENVISKKIPTDLKYSCLYWVHHFVRSKRCLDDDDCAFLYEHFLHWLEALSLLGHIPEGGIAIRGLAELTKFDQASEEFVDFVQDARRVITTFGPIISKAPLQIYASLLLLSPVASKVRQRLWSQRLPVKARVDGLDSDWDAHLQTIEDECADIFTFSPDGRFLAYIYRGREIQLWDVTTGTRQGTLGRPSSNGLIDAVAFSPNGKLLASVMQSDVIRVWDLTTMSQKLIFEDSHYPDERIVAMKYLGDRHAIVTVSSTRTIRIWDPETGACQHVHKDEAEEHDGSPAENDSLFGLGRYKPKFSPDGKLLAFHRGFGIKLWDLAGDKWQRVRLSGTNPKRDTHSISLSSNLLASISRDRKVRVWSVPAGILHIVFEIPDFTFVNYGGGYSAGFSISPNGQYIACGVSDGVQLWNSKTGQRECTIATYSTSTINFSPDSQLVALKVNSPLIQIWSVPMSTSNQQSFQDDGGYIEEIALSPDAKHFAELSDNGTVYLRDASTLSLLKKLVLFEGDGAEKITYQKLKFSPNNKLLAVYRDTPRAIEIFSLETGMADRMLDERTDFNFIGEVVFASNGKLMAAVWNEHEIALFHAGETTYRHILRPRGRFVYRLCFSSNGQILASASKDDNTIRLWNTLMGTCVLDIDVRVGHTLKMLHFSPDGLFIAAISAPVATFFPERMTWWDVATGVQMGDLEGQFSSFSLSTQTSLLCVCGRIYSEERRSIQKLYFYDMRTVQCQRTQEYNNDHAIEHMLFSPDGLLMVAALYDRTIWLWHTTTGEHLQTFQSHDGHIMRIKFSPDGKLIAAVHEKTIWLWSVSSCTRPQVIQLSTGFLRGIDFLDDQLVTSMSRDELDWSYGIWGSDTDTSLHYHTHSINISHGDRHWDDNIFNLDVFDEWITRGSTRIVWLPEDRRAWMPIRAHSAIYLGGWRKQSIVFQIV